MKSWIYNINKLINEILYKPTTKRFLLFVICLAVYVLFNHPLEKVIGKIIVKHLLSNINSVWYNDVVFGIIILSSCVYLAIKIKSYTPSKNSLFILCLSSLLYLYYRLSKTIWTFVSFSFYKIHIVYADILPFITIVNLILLAFSKPYQLPSNNKESFFDDAPVEKNGTDTLGFTTYATMIAKKINNSFFEKAFAIGVNGRWGSGKTSFINLLKKELLNDDIIEIDFNPWNSNSPQAVIKDFFETIQEKIRPYHSSTPKLLNDYSKKLVSLYENETTKSIHSFFSTVSDNDSLTSLFKNINDSLKNVNKKLVVFIDDLDRLDKEEIVEVIRLIRNTANFYNTFFIVAYDRTYVLKALSNHNPYNHEQFLEKIFQIEITLPNFNKNILRNLLLEKLKIVFHKKYYESL